MKYLILTLTILSIGSILLGYLVDLSYSQQLIGAGVVLLFIVVFPLFSYYRWKDKKLKDYMLTRENLDKMREFKNKKDDSI
ncbi:MAG: hypothetical protein KJO41_08850 [Bacteroidia bacterium]|nr:hypothetical protein [Bacteroidia bacterium]NND26019.1 hypothetical protein [Flavobacteriaceae bacterium]NNK60428.1 hypothetical protein [Flavobacteriaceae bacterium]RZW49495.1 MAG: hypothetical protein EX263_07840 [Flavobacteriaceae bacterium]